MPDPRIRGDRDRAFRCNLYLRCFAPQKKYFRFNPLRGRLAINLTRCLPLLRDPDHMIRVGINRMINPGEHHTAAAGSTAGSIESNVNL